MVEGYQRSTPVGLHSQSSPRKKVTNWCYCDQNCTIFSLYFLMRSVMWCETLEGTSGKWKKCLKFTIRLTAFEKHTYSSLLKGEIEQLDITWHNTNPECYCSVAYHNMIGILLFWLPRVAFQVRSRKWLDDLQILHVPLMYIQYSMYSAVCTVCTTDAKADI